MLYTNQKTLQTNGDSLQTAASEQKATRIYIHNYSAKDIKHAILPLQGGNCPVEELIAVGEAVFEFINNSEIDLHVKNAFGHLERLFDFYKNLIQSGNNRVILIPKD